MGCATATPRVECAKGERSESFCIYSYLHSAAWRARGSPLLDGVTPCAVVALAASSGPSRCQTPTEPDYSATSRVSVSSNSGHSSEFESTLNAAS
jgi:hypothetical protein